jgi:hypothetical protein
MLFILLGGISAACGPVAYYLVTYFGGRGTLSWGWSVSFQLWLLGSVVSLLIFLLLRQLFHTPHHDSADRYMILVAVCVFLAHYPIMFQMPPHGRIWTDGFIAGITSRGHLQELQAWAIERLAEHQNGTLKTRDAAHSSPLSRQQLDPASIPEYVQDIGGRPPSEGVSLAVIPSGILNPERVLNRSGELVGGYCIAISWYDFGMLVGDPLDFQIQPDVQHQWTHPWNFHEVQPGIFVYYIEK